MNDLVSVVMPAYNQEAYIGEAIRSVLSQGYPSLQVVVVDDGSTDATAERAAAFGSVVKLVRQENRGIYAAMNRAVQAAQGEWLTFLDADDLWTPGRLEKQFSAFQAQPHLASVYGHMQNFYSPETDAGFRAQVICEPNALPNPWNHTLMIRRTDFLRVGLFEPKWRLGSFIDWYQRAHTLGLEETMLPDVLVLRRLHPNNTGIRQLAARQDYALVMKAVLDRRRAQAKTSL